MPNLLSTLCRSSNRLTCPSIYYCRRSIITSYRPPSENDAKDTTPLYKAHIPISRVERTVLTVGSAVAALCDPLRGDMVATLGETTGFTFLKDMRDGMLSTATGRQILKERPTINSTTLDFKRLRQDCEVGTFGHAYISWLDQQRVTPDTRMPVHFVDDEELAYVMQRYREIHDFFHTLTGLGVTVEEELALKWFEWVHTGLPMTMLSSVFGPLRLSWAERYRLYGTYVPWALQCGASCTPLMNVYYEKHFYTPLDRFRDELGIIAPPSLSSLSTPIAPSASSSSSQSSNPSD